MNKERVKFFAKEIAIFFALMFILPLLTACIMAPLMKILGYSDIFQFEDIVSMSRWTVIASYLITPLTAKLPNFGKINRWWRFFIIYVMLS